MAPHVGLLSYPRSGNHLVRYLIEYLTERPTLGVIGSEPDTPIYQREGVKLLNNNALEKASPEVIKYHFATDIVSYSEKYPLDTLIFILRDPVEAYASHIGETPFLWSKETWREEEQNSLTTHIKPALTQMMENINYFNQFEGNKMFICYEDLVFHNPNQVITELAEFVASPADRLKHLLENLSKYLKDSRRTPVRKTSAHVTPDYYSSRVRPANLQFLKEAFNGVDSIGK